MDHVPFSSPESKAALELIKHAIREVSPDGYIDGIALQVLGGTEEEVETEVRRLVLQLVEALKTAPVSEVMRVALPVAAGHLVRDRLKEIHLKGRA